jgi:hypothetical protein
VGPLVKWKAFQVIEGLFCFLLIARFKDLRIERLAVSNLENDSLF